MAIVAAVCGLVAFVTLRVAEEDYFAIVTLGVGEMLRLIALNEDGLTKGRWASPHPAPLNAWIPPTYYPYFMLALSIVLVLACLWVLNRLSRSPFGRVVRAVREDDVVAATLGKNVLWARLRIFAIGGAFIGLAARCTRSTTSTSIRPSSRPSSSPTPSWPSSPAAAGPTWARSRAPRW